MIGKVIDYQAKQITYNVYSFFKVRKSLPKSYENETDINLIDTVATVTGLSKSSVTRIIREGNAMKIETGSVVFNPQAKKKHIRKKRIEVDEVKEGLIRRKVIQFYTVKNEVPSVRRLNALLKEEDILVCSNEYLRQLLHKLGFTNAENDSEGMLRERPDIIEERHKYLQRIKEFRAQGKTIFYLNDTRRWNLFDTTMDKPQEMPRFIMVHASGDTGFSDGEILKMKAKSKTDGDSSFDNFENYAWMKGAIIPNIPSSSVIVINVPYCETAESTVHDEKPTMATTRTVMQDWLKRHNIPFKETDAKYDLFKIINKQEASLQYSLTGLMKEKKHEVLHLPQNHVDLNPTALVWEQVKENVEKISPKVIFKEYHKNKWAKCFEDVERNEEEYYSHDSKVDDPVHILHLKKEVKSDSEDSMDYNS